MDDSGTSGRIGAVGRSGDGTIEEGPAGSATVLRIELPGGARLEQPAIHLPPRVTVAVLRDRRVLMAWRHPLVPDQWVWELPGGYLRPGESPQDCAIREVTRDTGWCPGPLERLLAFQPMVGAVDAEQIVYLARGAQRSTGPAARHEPEKLTWVPLDDVMPMMQRGEILGAASVVALLAVLGRSGEIG